jgi:exodeoxyribonuclease VII large subunit
MADLARALPKPEALLAERAQRFDMATTRLPQTLRTALQSKRLELASGKAQNFGPGLLSQTLTSKHERTLGLSSRLLPFAKARVTASRTRLDALKLPNEGLATRLRAASDRLNAEGQRLERQVQSDLQLRQERLAGAMRVAESVGPQATLNRGYAIVRGDGGALVPDKKTASTQSSLEIEFRDGRFTMSKSKPQRGSARKDQSDQGSLFD